MNGRIKKLLMDKGYGFIKGADNQDYFFHRSVMPDFDSRKEGDKVEFTPVTIDKKRRAADIVCPPITTN